MKARGMRRKEGNFEVKNLIDRLQAYLQKPSHVRAR
jgi:hypothetical protein